MSHCLTQPEEIDHILMAMAGNDVEVDTPIPDGTRSSRAIRDVEREKINMKAGFPYGEMQKNTAHGLSDP